MSLDRNQLFDGNQDWASTIARNVHRKVPPSFELDDLKQEAWIELWKRAQQYDPNNARGTPFQAYAYLYVRGAVLMFCRRRFWVEATHGRVAPENRATLGASPDGSALPYQHADPRPRIDARIEAAEAEDSDRRLLIHFFEAVPPPVPESVLLLRMVCLDGVDLEELACERRVTKADISRMLNGGVKQLRKYQRAMPDGPEEPHSSIGNCITSMQTQGFRCAVVG